MKSEEIDAFEKKYGLKVQLLQGDTPVEKGNGEVLTADEGDAPLLHLH